MRATPILLVLAACSAPKSAQPERALAPPEPSSPTEPRPESIPDAAQSDSIAAPPKPTTRLRANLLRTFAPSKTASPYAWQRLENVGDWDGDGIVDIAVNESLQKEPYTPGFAVVSQDGRPLAKHMGSPAIARWAFGGEGDKRFTAVGDVDADQRADIVLLSSGFGADGARVCVLQAFGAESDAPIWTQNIHVPDDCMPFTVHRLGDLDDDGVSDVGVGMPPWTGVQRTGEDSLDDWTERGWIEIRSGIDGRILWRVQGDTLACLGWEIVRHADVDRDGVEDVGVVVVARDANHLRSGSMDPPSRIDLRSGATGKLLKRIPPSPIPEAPGLIYHPTPNHLRDGEDVDGDGVIDLAGRTLNVNASDFVDVISGRTREVFARLSAHPDPNGRTQGEFPSDVAVASDFDGDGWRDLLIGHDEVGPRDRDFGAIYLHSTRTNERLLEVWGGDDDYKLGRSIAWLGDTDGDGAPEFAAVTHLGVRIWAIEREVAK